VLLAAAGLALVAPTASASAQTSGTVSSQGFLIVTGVSGERVVQASLIRFKGVFNGVGKIVEVPNLPTDPDTASRHNLVFHKGTLHLVSVVQDFQFNLDPKSCRFRVTIPQISRFEGGTGVFRGATGKGTGLVTALGILQRAPDGTCSQDLLPAHEIDIVSGSGTLTFWGANQTFPFRKPAPRQASSSMRWWTNSSTPA
jgi:hypothetical protein